MWVLTVVWEITNWSVTAWFGQPQREQPQDLHFTLGQRLDQSGGAAGSGFRSVGAGKASKDAPGKLRQGRVGQGRIEADQ